ncbi:glycosyltransferase family 2 protein [Anabaena subtropica]|uniref:Glycosyltransferase family 2 protein n=1 Tax=Anabaena subtropica FACHB-260 TaxID=2692884 RepID=A0ABR8CKQ6_9NOST|nr:glycosyltransferase family 2 protein [Anabaena subtropica]MBD2343418.1 glycosyltransferase family 2 protein [Anabaena subtropica FACHB-260]
MSLKTPVGFLIFNRPDLTEQVFAAIAQAKPEKLFVIADGPRFPEEAEKCQQTRSIINKVDWDCEVFTNFSEINLGCGRREATGFDWVFSQVEEAIFLEDDTLPAPSFFSFCEAMLEHYRHDERIMHINGDNSVNHSRTEYSYYFSKYMHGWGWASWRRAWQHYDYYMKTWPEFKQQGLLELIFEDLYEQQYWTNLFDQMYEDPQVIDTWDYQWTYACWSQGGLVIAPNKNLITNLGFNRPDAAHTTGDSPRSKLATTDIWKIKHPPFIVRQTQADQHTFDYIFGGKQMRQQDQPLMKIRRRLSSVKKKLLFVS